MKKVAWIIIAVVIIVLIIIIFSGLNSICGGWKCELKWFNIVLSTSTYNPIVGGCAGVHYSYWQECCDNWAEENGIVHAQCTGGWIVKNNQCEWQCSNQECTNDESCWVVCSDDSNCGNEYRKCIDGYCLTLNSG